MYNDRNIRPAKPAVECPEGKDSKENTIKDAG